MPAEPIMELLGVDKYFGNLAAVNQITLAFEEGEFFTLVGPSGSGKTTLLRMLAGMDKPTRGDILLRGERVNDRPANWRPTCMVFQSLALFPHMTVGGNVEYPLKCRGTPPSERKERAARCLELSHLPISYYDRPVTTCSGGERQRVALARALAFDPEILFFDEPLSAIDYRLRKTLEKEIKDIQRETKKTFVYITHSLEEAMVMSDRIGVMRDGGLAQIGSPHEIYSNPVNRFVCEFMGEVNSIAVTRGNGGELWCESMGAAITPPSSVETSFRQGTLMIRPENMRLVNPDEPCSTNVFSGELFNEYVLGSRIQYQIRCKNDTFLVERLREAGLPKSGDQVSFGWNPEDSMLFPE
ncbi:Putrescine transport ATP-binding protein PotA (TC 3.A.1.11.1) [hydrothermal vent metagenome]|uniref:Putrescine transport ATP-binding protein PotA (TC 3.A.1.11.1) n=1 Tax=hydrothermal vent metagenome TaxID=652676 RepID=A0A160TVM7_9ZZZZ|nr:ABC transporter ATP-binding protein [Pseudomonadales bacterium]MCH2484604.1 ABC transporter ATP-binding protein [Gammaproteobacteria bacterium]